MVIKLFGWHPHKKGELTTAHTGNLRQPSLTPWRRISFHCTALRYCLPIRIALRRPDRMQQGRVAGDWAALMRRSERRRARSSHSAIKSRPEPKLVSCLPERGEHGRVRGRVLGSGPERVIDDRRRRGPALREDRLGPGLLVGHQEHSPQNRRGRGAATRKTSCARMRAGPTRCGPSCEPHRRRRSSRCPRGASWSSGRARPISARPAPRAGTSWPTPKATNSASCEPA